MHLWMLQAPVVQGCFQPGTFFLPQASSFAGMGIESCHYQVGGWVEALAEGQQSIQLALHQGSIEMLGYGGQGNVGGGQQGVEAPVARGC